MAKMTQVIADQAAQIAGERDRMVERIMAAPNQSRQGKQQAVAKQHQKALDATESSAPRHLSTGHAGRGVGRGGR